MGSGDPHRTPHICTAVNLLTMLLPKPKISFEKKWVFQPPHFSRSGFCWGLFNVRINNITVNKASWLSCRVSIAKIRKHLIVSAVSEHASSGARLAGATSSLCLYQLWEVTFLYGFSDVGLHMEFRSLCCLQRSFPLILQYSFDLKHVPPDYVPSESRGGQRNGEKDSLVCLLFGLTLCSESLVPESSDLIPNQTWQSLTHWLGYSLCSGMSSGSLQRCHEVPIRLYISQMGQTQQPANRLWGLFLSRNLETLVKFLFVGSWGDRWVRKAITM